MPKLPSAYRCPAVLVGVGACFSIIGVIPMAAALALETKTSATVIGLGFIAFGLMLVLPGVCWCILVLQSKSKCITCSRSQDQHKQNGFLRLVYIIMYPLQVY